jgi:hypothetical protein
MRFSQELWRLETLPERRAEGWYCPLFSREIEVGLCLDINYQCLGLFKVDVLGDAQKESGKTVQEISEICEACPNQPLSERIVNTKPN